MDNEMNEMNETNEAMAYFKNFFEEQFDRYFTEKTPCEDTEDGCEDEKEGTMVNGFLFKDRIMIYIEDSMNIVFWRELEVEEFDPLFEFGEDIFEGKIYDMIPEIAKLEMYQDKAVIFSEGKEIFSGHANIGEIISMVIKEQERILEVKTHKRWENE
jgi:hypothetical protein